jgi:O-antigen/teichoic acid export membrane protein
VPVLGWGLVLAIAWYSGHADPVYLAKAYLVLLFLVMVLVLVVTSMKIGGPFLPDLSKTKKMLVFGLPSLATTLPLVLNMRLDQLCIAGFLPPKALGLYVVGVAWGSMANPFLYGLGTILFPRIAAIGDESRRKEALTRGSRLAVIACLFLAFLLALPAIVLVPFLFGEQFRSAGILACLLTFGAITAGFNLVLQEGLRGFGKPIAVMWSELSGFVVTASLLSVLLPRWGIVGAAIGSFFGYQTVALLLLLQAKRIVRSPLVDFLMPAVADLRLIRQTFATYLPERLKTPVLKCFA